MTRILSLVSANSRPFALSFFRALIPGPWTIVLAFSFFLFVQVCKVGYTFLIWLCS
ncbi:hypothetical protein [Spirosoma harenae]